MSSNQYKIKRKNHPNKQNLAISNFMKNSQFTDIMLVAAGGTLKAHRLILAASSSYFYNLFLSDSCDMKKSQMCLIDNVSFVDLSNIVRYIYDGELTFDRDYLTHFIRVGDLFGIMDIHNLEINTVNPNVGDTPEEIIKVEVAEGPNLIETQVNVEVQPKVDIPVPGPPKKPNILRSTSKPVDKIEKLKVFTPVKAKIEEDEKLFLEQLNLIPKIELPKTRSKTAPKKPLKRLIIKLPRLTRRFSTIGPQKLECRHCSRPYNVSSSLRNHEKFCILNTNRSVSICNICNEEVPPGSMTFHKRRYHDHVPQSRRLTIDVEMFNP
ncbi:unnamed protein product [Chironomus riparius]|uniref:BTB domain-containing protein n=1 Tax=Chironomus riparius TaxID=315576 RepID=A0A9N9RXT5_9DIPT|nr:unnamed protein product [Chironomus riparius]